MDETVSDYHQGDQAIGEQVSTYRVFGSLTKWAALAIATMMLTFTLWFCTAVGFFGGLIPGLIVLAAGIFFLRAKPDAGR